MRFPPFSGFSFELKGRIERHPSTALLRYAATHGTFTVHCTRMLYNQETNLQNILTLLKEPVRDTSANW
jgi:hypothetical protein